MGLSEDIRRDAKDLQSQLDSLRTEIETHSVPQLEAADDRIEELEGEVADLQQKLEEAGGE